MPDAEPPVTLSITVSTSASSVGSSTGATVSRILVVKAHETSLASSQEFFAGSRAALRCEVHGVKSLAENIPLAGAEVNIHLRAKDGKVSFEFEERKAKAPAKGKAKAADEEGEAEGGAHESPFPADGP